MINIVRAWVMSLLFVVLCTACQSGGSWQTKSAGRAYEVVLVDDIDSIFSEELSATIDFLPQPEPAFDVSTTDKNHFRWNMKQARNVVIIDTAANKHETVTIEYEHDTYASPQIIISVKAANARTIREKRKTIGRELRQLLHAQERRNEMQNLQKAHAPEPEKAAREMFGVDISIPADMTHLKRGKDFLWISDDGTSVMRNVCLFKGENIDSILQANIKGETDEMYMTLVEQQPMKEQHPPMTEGLWAMKGDAMGGPFVMLKSGNLTVLGFVYAPNMKKRNHIRQLETAMLSLKDAAKKRKKNIELKQ